jgi:hypothetical protein
MRWLKIDAARQHCGGISRRVMYDAVAAGKLRAARIGEGRNLIFSDEWCDDWLKTESVQDQDRKTAA